VVDAERAVSGSQGMIAACGCIGPGNLAAAELTGARATHIQPVGAWSEGQGMRSREVLRIEGAATPTRQPGVRAFS